MVLWLLGYPDHALRRSQDSLALARELSHPSTMANALFFTVWVHLHRGEGQAVQARTQEGLALATDQGFRRWLAQGTFLQGWLLAEQDQKEAGIVQMLKVLAVERTSAASARWDVYYTALLGEAYRKAGQTVEGLNVVTEALARHHQTECRYYEAELVRIKGELLLKPTVANEKQAESYFQQAIEVARSQQAKSLELRAVMSLSRLWQGQGKKEEARQLLAEINGWFTEGFDTADLKAAKALLEELS
jgi:predicted ATPase